MTNAPKLQRGQRLSAKDREQVGQDLLREYDAGASIRQLCARTGYSIGRVRRLLEDAGVAFRPRGGFNRERSAGSGRA